MMIICKVIINSNCFKFDGENYEQKMGDPIGSPFLVFLVEFKIKPYEKKESLKILIKLLLFGKEMLTFFCKWE